MCEYCEKNKVLKSCNFAGSGEIRIYYKGFEKGIGMLELQGDGMKAKIFKHLYCPRFDILYCPMCRKEAGRVKTERTRRLEELLESHFSNRNEFYVFECTLGWYGSEIVDCVMYNCDRQVYCYEIKQNVQDFHSKNKLSFFGNKNYFVMPYSLYEKVKDEIPREIGVYVAIEKLEQKEEITADVFGNKWTKHWAEPIDGLKELYCIKPARKQEVKADKEVILSSMLRSMQRDRAYAIPKEDKQ